MPPRMRNSVVLAFLILVSFYLFSRNSSDKYDAYPSDYALGRGKDGAEYGGKKGFPQFVDHVQPAAKKTKRPYLGLKSTTTPALSSTSSLQPGIPGSTPEPEPETETVEVASSSSSAGEQPTSETEEAEKPKALNLQEHYQIEYDDLETLDTFGAIYGNTLNDLIDTNTHEGFPASILRPADAQMPFSESTPYKYNPYPEYNIKAWKLNNTGNYLPCDGPHGLVQDILGFQGHPKIFGHPPMGSYSILDIDNNICFERETRLGNYGYLESKGDSANSSASTVWNKVNWGNLQEQCAKKNLDRYVQGRATNHAAKVGSSERVDDQTGKHELRGLLNDTAVAPGKARTAVLIRACVGRNYTENDKQNIRSLVTELSLRSGGEYQVYLLLQLRDESLPIWTNDTAYNQAVLANVPEEFSSMTILWTETQMRELYPKIPGDAQDVYTAQHLPLQHFSLEHPEFEYFWNWEVDVRFTGNHYDIVEKLARFSKAQPRKGLWERNERFYIPSFHGDYSTAFRENVERLSGTDTVWGPVPLANTFIVPSGPNPPVADPKDDNYEWGVSEEADYISLAPMFNPVGTNWFMRTEVWSYEGPERTPRRTSIGTHSRLSRKLLTAMHTENLKGNHFASEMQAPSVALLHGLKAVYAPIPMFFDRAWDGKSLDRYFNPGGRWESGGVLESPFSFGNENRFRGSTWYYRSTPPQRLWNHWLGWEDSGIGGPEWEKVHGRPCLPAMFLHPVKDSVETFPGYSSFSTA